MPSHLLVSLCINPSTMKGNEWSDWRIRSPLFAVLYGGVPIPDWEAELELVAEGLQCGADLQEGIHGLVTAGSQKQPRTTFLMRDGANP